MKWCDRNLIQSPCHYGLCTSKVDFQCTLKKMGIPVEDWPLFLAHPSADATTTFFEHDGKAIMIVSLRCKRRRKAEIHALLCHEAVHVWRKICELLGEDEPSSEFEAYAIQMITLNLIKELS